MKKPTDKFSFNGRIRSIGHAAEGIGLMIKSQQNACLHLIATFVVLIAGIILNLELIKWCFLILAIMSVWVAEALNTAFELLCDVTSPEFHPIVKMSKDVAAGAVLISALGSVLIGLLIFGPYLLEFLK